MIINVRLTLWNPNTNCYEISAFFEKINKKDKFDTHYIINDEGDVEYLKLHFEGCSSSYKLSFKTTDKYAMEVYKRIFNALAHQESWEGNNGDFISVVNDET